METITRPAALVRQGSLKLYATSLMVSDLKRPNFYTINKLDPDDAGPGYQRLLNEGRAKRLAEYRSMARAKRMPSCRRRFSWPRTRTSRSTQRQTQSRST